MKRKKKQPSLGLPRQSIDDCELEEDLARKKLQQQARSVHSTAGFFLAISFVGESVSFEEALAAGAGVAVAVSSSASP